MIVGTIVESLRSGIHATRQRTLGAADVGTRTLRSAGAIVADSVQQLAKTQAGARRDILLAARTRVRQAREDATEIIGKTRAQLAQTLREGYQHLSERASGVPSHRDHAEARKAEVRQKKARARAEREAEEEQQHAEAA